MASVSQWTLFLGIGLILFGWIEKKEKLTIAGQLSFLLLGLLSAWVILTNNVAIPNANGNPISKDVKILSYFKLAAFFAGFNLLSLLLLKIKPQFHKFSLSLLVFVGLMLFFMVFGILQIPK